MMNIAVIGAGTMGNGIAHVFAQHGFPVRLVDRDAIALDKAVQTIRKNLERQVRKEVIDTGLMDETLLHISTHTSLEQSVVDTGLVIEAATEDPAVKTAIFKALDQAAPPEAILATNTSSIAIGRMAAATHRPDRVIGMHFMNPVPVMKLVEVVRGKQTSSQVVDQVVALSKELEKIPVIVNDYPGFVSNRVLMPMINEAIFALYEGVAGVQEIDEVMHLGMAHPLGPLQLADLIGLDVCLNIMKVLRSGFDNPKYDPCPLLVELVSMKQLGVKTGVGFYEYEPGGKDPAVAKRFRGQTAFH